MLHVNSSPFLLIPALTALACQRDLGSTQPIKNPNSMQQPVDNQNEGSKFISGELVTLMSGKELEICSSSISGRTIFIQKDSTFKSCNGSSWIPLKISATTNNGQTDSNKDEIGATGPQGPKR